jgi:integrase/recombinase XerD
MDPRFELFIQEKKYLRNVPPATVEWYRASLKWLPTPSPDAATLKAVVMRMREKGLRATSCNCHIRAINTQPWR